MYGIDIRLKICMEDVPNTYKLESFKFLKKFFQNLRLIVNWYFSSSRDAGNKTAHGTLDTSSFLLS